MLGGSLGCSDASESYSVDIAAEACGEATCGAGQHCNNLVCEAGCKTEQNCDGDSVCVVEDATMQLGTCLRVLPPSKDCDAYCGKLSECGTPSGDCEQQCDAASLECIDCVIEGVCGSPCRTTCG